MRIGSKLSPRAAVAICVLGLATTGLLSTAAWAASANTVTVRGPHRVRSGHRVRLLFTGHASHAVRALLVFLDDRRCAAAAHPEARRREVRRPVSFHVPPRYEAKLLVEHSVTGRHFVCAYLVHRRSGRTMARGTWRYVTR